MTQADGTWDSRHAGADGVGTPARVLRENLHLLPAEGKALDLACGRGANSLLLAQAGLVVSAWDKSPVAIERLRSAAMVHGLTVDCEVRDLLRHPPPADHFDLVLVAHFLERSLCPAILDSLKPGGLLFYQTFASTCFGGGGPGRPEWRLQDNELLRLFPGVRLRVYREEVDLGDTDQGWRDLAMMVAQKPR